SAGQCNAATNAAPHNMHGTGLESLRNTALDAKTYFSKPGDPPPVFRQNQFGGTFGGPLVKNKTFFFIDYQGTRQTQAPTQTATLPSLANFGGDFTDSAGSFADSHGNPFGVNGQGFADVLNARMNLPARTITDGA